MFYLYYLCLVIQKISLDLCCKVDVRLSHKMTKKIKYKLINASKEAKLSIWDIKSVLLKSVKEASDSNI